jgi:hypothetical protein
VVASGQASLGEVGYGMVKPKRIVKLSDLTPEMRRVIEALIHADKESKARRGQPRPGGVGNGKAW